MAWRWCCFAGRVLWYLTLQRHGRIVDLERWGTAAVCSVNERFQSACAQTPRRTLINKTYYQLPSTRPPLPLPLPLRPPLSFSYPIALHRVTNKPALHAALLCVTWRAFRFSLSKYIIYIYIIVYNIRKQSSQRLDDIHAPHSAANFCCMYVPTFYVHSRNDPHLEPPPPLLL